MKIRTFQPGDEAPQAAIYNEAAGTLPRFKPAKEEEVRRRCRAADFDPRTRLYAEAEGRLVAYATFHANGRVSYPWCRPGHEDAAEPLFQATLSAMTERGIRSAFVAYRGDWEAQLEFFLAHGFRQSREMVNFIFDIEELPGRRGTLTRRIESVQPDDLPALARMMSRLRPLTSAVDLGRWWFENPYFRSDALFVIRESGEPVAVGALIADNSYTDPGVVDANMPCFRLGAFGTEGMQVKRLNGLFSFMAADRPDVGTLAGHLLVHGMEVFEKTGGKRLAAQAFEDAPYLFDFYRHIFRRQGSFPILERDL